jgi:hypothetical protein
VSRITERRRQTWHSGFKANIGRTTGTGERAMKPNAAIRTTCLLHRALNWPLRALLVAAISTAAPANAQSDDLLAWRAATSMPKLVDILDNWLDANSDMPRNEQAPIVRQVDGLSARDMSGTHYAADSNKTRGLYDEQSGAIWLVRPWDNRNPYDVSVLLHELIHHRQAVAGHWYCAGAQELPAYRLQQTWLAELGLEPNVNWIAVVLESSCTPRDIHPA